MSFSGRSPVQIACVTSRLDATAGVRFVEIAQIGPQIRQFFAHIKQEQR